MCDVMEHKQLFLEAPGS